MPVRLNGIRLGTPVDLLLDPEDLRAVGLDLRCGDKVHRFLPMPAVKVADGAIVLRSPLVLLEDDQLAFYRKRSLSLTSLRGAPVERDGRTVGRLTDVVVGPRGELSELVVGEGPAERRLPFGTGIRLRPKNRSAA